jgi:hypothetical protein
MEGQRSNPPSSTLKTAYQQVLATQKVNASMLKWSLAFAEAEKARRTSGQGVTLYLL